jgi:hypothetical protein
MPDDKARAAFKGLPGAKVVMRVLAALRDNTNNEEEPGNDEEEDGFFVTQDDDTKDDEILGDKAPKVQ